MKDLFGVVQNQPSRSVLKKICSESMQQIYRGTPMPKCDFNKVALELYWNHTLAWMFSCKFAAFFQNTFSEEHLWVAASNRCNLLSFHILLLMCGVHPDVTKFFLNCSIERKDYKRSHWLADRLISVEIKVSFHNLWQHVLRRK